MTDQLIAEQLLNAAKAVEKQVDAEIQRLDNLDDDGLEEIRRNRIAQMKEAARKRQDQEANGHGRVQELANGTDFFDAGKKSEKVVCHFFLPTVRKCEFVDACFEKLAQAHFGTRFVKINAEKVPNLIKMLRITHIPNICVIIDNKIANYLRVTDESGSEKDKLLAHIEKWLLNENGIEKLLLTKGK
ncbi:hypothetical protein FO519_003721 [Halicephalobus sp. NKZ332]|nr:hypothetical protein FO519_003721 [Halicephalobus sp. NKZ332]